MDRLVYPAVLGVAVIVFLTGWLAGLASRTTERHRSAVIEAKALFKLKWRHRLTAVLMVTLMVVAIRAFMIEDGVTDEGPGQPEKAGVPSPSRTR